MRFMKGGCAAGVLLLSVVLAGASMISVHAASTVWAYILVGDGSDEIPYLGGKTPLLGGMQRSTQQAQFLKSAETIRDALTKGWHVPSGQIETHHAWGMAHNDLGSTMDEFFKNADSDDILIFYYVGHGVEDLMAPMFSGTSITGAEAVPIDVISYKDMNAHLEGHGRERFAILDACNSGSAIDSMKDSAWVLASVCGEWPQGNWPTLGGGTPFSANLAAAMLATTSARTAFAATQTETLLYFGLSPQLCLPEFSSPYSGASTDLVFSSVPTVSAKGPSSTSGTSASTPSGCPGFTAWIKNDKEDYALGDSLVTTFYFSEGASFTIVAHQSSESYVCMDGNASAGTHTLHGSVVAPAGDQWLELIATSASGCVVHAEVRFTSHE